VTVLCIVLSIAVWRCQVDQQQEQYGFGQQGATSMAACVLLQTQYMPLACGVAVDE